MGIIPRRPPPRWLPLLSPLNRASRSPCVTGGLHRLRLRDLFSSSSLPPLRRIGSPYLRRLVTSARAQETRPEKKEKERWRGGEECSLECSKDSVLHSPATPASTWTITRVGDIFVKTRTSGKPPRNAVGRTFERKIEGSHSRRLRFLEYVTTAITMTMTTSATKTMTAR